MSIWLAKSFIDYYDYTADQDFLKEKAYVFTKEVCDAILNMMEERDGKLYLPLSSSPEYNDAEKESFLEWSNNDIQLVNYGFKEVVRLAKILGKEEETKKFEVALTKLDEYYVNDKLIMCLDNHGQMIEKSHRHHANVMNIYPLKTLRPTDETKALTIDRNLYWLENLGYGQWVGFSYPWFAGLSASNGHANRALFHLQMFARCFCGDNGFHLNGDFKKYGVSLFHYRPFTIEANYCFCDVLQDMLLEDKDEFINAFSCVPYEWTKKEFSFNNFLCRGGYYASAKYNNGKIVEFSLRSKEERTVKIKNNFGFENLSFSNGAVINCKKDDIFELTFKGEISLL
jgi:alpha-L-fucosidase 2